MQEIFSRNIVEAKQHLLCRLLFVHCKKIDGEIDSRLEMVARDEHSSLFIESIIERLNDESRSGF
jgi:hypothetical protein